jgi:hypothetical protein
VTLTPEQRAALEDLGDITEDQFLQPQYAKALLGSLYALWQRGEPLDVDDAGQWAREREWSERHAGMLAGVAWAVKYGFDPAYGEALAPRSESWE